MAKTHKNTPKKALKKSTVRGLNALVIALIFSGFVVALGTALNLAHAMSVRGKKTQWKWQNTQMPKELRGKDQWYRR